MILIISHKDDYTTDYLVNILNKRKISYHRLNTEDIGAKHEVTVLYEPKLVTQIDHQNFFQSVWFRRTKLPENRISSPVEQKFYDRDFRLFLNSFWTTIRTDKWLSYPDFVYRAENKLLQLSIAHELGLKTPETIISTDRIKIKEFHKKHNGNIILKPLFEGRFIEGGEQKLIFTNKVKEVHLKQEDYLLFPIIFQEEISKDYELRVTVVDDKVFSAKVNSQSKESTKVDWRRDRLKFELYSLPKEIELKCIKLVKKLGLAFGAIDLIRSNDQYIFLEINPNGQWVWIESDTGLKISEAIINYLID